MHLDGLRSWRPLIGRLRLRAAVWLQAKVRYPRPGCNLGCTLTVCDGGAAKAVVVALSKLTLRIQFFT